MAYDPNDPFGLNGMSNWGMPAQNASSIMDPNFGSFSGANNMVNPLAGYVPEMATSGTGGSSNMFSSLFGGTDANGVKSMGWGMPALDLGKSLFGGWLGLQQLGQAKDSLAFQKDAFSKQFENQRTLTNTEMQDRQNARVASNPGAYQSTPDYMAAHGV